MQRRVYSVETIDGNHKLIRWKLVVHGGIDGKTRTIVFLHCASNNLAATVLRHFQCAVNQCGLPDCVRTDRGGENVDMWLCFLGGLRPHLAPPGLTLTHIVAQHLQQSEDL